MLHPLELVYKLAEDHAVTPLSGDGFDAPNLNSIQQVFEGKFTSVIRR